MKKLTVSDEFIDKRIFIIRGQRVMIDSDLADLYDVETGGLNQAVRRNMSRFPEDFMFQLTKEEHRNLISQIVISSYGGRRHAPYVFTEHGVTMLASILRSERAVAMSIFIVRAFIKMREMLAIHKDLALKISEIERKQKEQGDQLDSVYSVVKQLINPPPKLNRKMGFE